VAVATLIAGALLAFTLAFWGWRWLGPTPVVAPVADKVPEPWAAAIVAAAPFGRSVATTAPPPTAVPQSTGLPADTRLLGIFAGRDGEGYALFRLPDRGAILASRGQDIVSGVKVEAIHADRIEINDRGQRRDMPLHRADAIAPGRPAPAPAPSRPVATAPSPPAPATRAACARPPGFNGPVYKLNAELLAGMVGKPETWSGLLASTGDALVVRDETGLAAMLGMKSGDRVLQSNGIALVSIDDMVTAVVRPLIASQPVHVTGSRDGQPREWLFLNAGACPA
jgi:hypothetical protein